MYIGNASLQRHLFTYRIPEQTKERTVPIESMSQAMLPDDMTSEDVAAILAQHEVYGLISVEQLRSVKMKSRATLVYSLGKPLTSVAIDTMFQLNRGVLDDFGRRIRQETAVVSNLAVNRALDDMRQQGFQADMRKFQVSVVEDEPAGGFTTPTPIVEGYEMAPEAPTPSPTRGSRNARRAKS